MPGFLCVLRSAVAFALIMAAFGCSGGGGGELTRIVRDTTLAALVIPAGAVTSIENGAILTVTGNVAIAGTLQGTDGPVQLRVGGDLDLDGTLQAVHSGMPTLNPDGGLSGQGNGVYVTVAGAVDVGATAKIRTNGHVVFTDDAAQLDRTPREVSGEADTADSDLPTVVPLPPDDPHFGSAVIEPAPREASQAPALPPVVIGGNWDLTGFPGDLPVVLLNFRGDREMQINNLRLMSPNGVKGIDADGTDDPGTSKLGGNGKRGMNLNIKNNPGAVKFVGSTIIDLADGGPGGDATAVCASATGGNGGKPGNLRITGGGGIDISGGTLILNTGRGGNGGKATVNKGPAGAAGCPGVTGADATADGGRGGDNEKAMFIRGNVQSPESVILSGIRAGDGGEAIATACDGGSGNECCDGGTGGAATASGGQGGDASLNLGGTSIEQLGSVDAGKGGKATATGGRGGDGGDCKFDNAGDGGAGGAATATGGQGGSAETSGGAGTPTGGDGGDAVATGGRGGDGGDSALGQPGAGGLGGEPTATPGEPGTPSPAFPGETETSTSDGNPGQPIEPIVFCLPFDFLADGDLVAGPRDAPVQNLDHEPVGSIRWELIGSTESIFRKQSDPAPHIGIENGTLAIDLTSLELTQGTPGAVTGINIAPLGASGINPGNPLLVQLLDGSGEEISTIQVQEVPSNFGNTEDPEMVQLPFSAQEAEAVRSIRIVVPPGAFVTFLRIYLVDP